MAKAVEVIVQKLVVAVHLMRAVVSNVVALPGQKTGTPVVLVRQSDHLRMPLKLRWVFRWAWRLGGHV